MYLTNERAKARTKLFSVRFLDILFGRFLRGCDFESLRKVIRSFIGIGKKLVEMKGRTLCAIFEEPYGAPRKGNYMPTVT